MDDWGEQQTAILGNHQLKSRSGSIRAVVSYSWLIFIMALVTFSTSTEIAKDMLDPGLYYH